MGTKTTGSPPSTGIANRNDKRPSQRLHERQKYTPTRGRSGSRSPKKMGYPANTLVAPARPAACRNKPRLRRTIPARHVGESPEKLSSARKKSEPPKRPHSRRSSALQNIAIKTGISGAGISEAENSRAGINLRSRNLRSRKLPAIVLDKTAQTIHGRLHSSTIATQVLENPRGLPTSKSMQTMPHAANQEGHVQQCTSNIRGRKHARRDLQDYRQRKERCP